MIYITLFGINNLIKPKAHWLQHRTMHLGNICLMDMVKDGKRDDCWAEEELAQARTKRIAQLLPYASDGLR